MTETLLIGTSETFAYIHHQLDFPLAARRKLHLVAADESRTYCGRATSGWEIEEVVLDDVYLSALCQVCARVASLDG